MNKAEIDKIRSFKIEVENLPDELLSPEDISTFMRAESENEKQTIYSKEQTLFENVKDLKIRLIAYLSAVTGEDSTYIDFLGNITFRPKEGIYNTIHYRNNEAWLEDKTKLLDLLKMAENEFIEKVRITQLNSNTSRFGFFKSKEAKGIMFAALLTLISGFITKDIWIEKLFSKEVKQKKEISPDLTLINTDKNNVIKKASLEVFTNYYRTIENLETKYASSSAFVHFDNYLSKEVSNIEKRINSKSYIQRFASNVNLWSDKDINDVNELIRNRTIIRMEEIYEDMENKSQGVFFQSEDKLRLLKEAAKNELNE